MLGTFHESELFRNLMPNARHVSCRHFARVESWDIRRYLGDVFHEGGWDIVVRGGAYQLSIPFLEAVRASFGSCYCSVVLVFVV